MTYVKEKNRTDIKDEDIIFCELLASQLRKIDLPDKLMIRMKISQQIHYHQNESKQCSKKLPGEEHIALKYCFYPAKAYNNTGW